MENTNNAFDFAKSFNKTRKFKFDAPEDFEYVSLETLYKENGEDKTIYPIRAMYINTKGEYGDAPVFVTDTCFVNIPEHMTKTVNEILENEQAVEAINNGKVGFSIYTYTNKRFKRLCYNAMFVNL